MSKIRVYELAKELGLENKAVLDLCEALEISGKKSHSSTLSEEESEKIRRSVIRQAMSGREGGGLTREVTTDGGVMTERRMGNVIRRRKKIAEEGEEEVEERPGIDLTDAPQTSISRTGFAPNLAMERSMRNEAIARANALFKEKEEEEQEVAAEGVVPDSGSAVELAEPQQETAAGEVSPAPEAPADGKPEERRLRPGPKILGKIELAPRVEPKREERKDARAKVVPIAEPVAEGAKGVRPKKKAGGEEELIDGEPRRKIRKKQVLRKDELVDQEGDRDAWRGRKDRKSKLKGKEGAEPLRPVKRTVKIDNEISVGEFAKAMGVKMGDVMTQLMNLGTMATINQLIDFDTAALVAGVFGVTVVNTGRDEEQFLTSLKSTDTAEELALRPPVVTVMGHVDHGKTSLLDAIRKTSVTTGEAGGITQHIGAYNVVLPSGGSVTFLDTPGHEAFTAMRSRGAKVTDIVVLVVAADDGVMPQTVEAINHAKAAKVPIIVAINKIDKEDANLDRIKSQMSEHGLIPEDWGGDTIVVPVSAKTKVGVEELLQNLYAQAEVLELKANPSRNAFGVVIESRLDRGRGPVLSVLVHSGTLHRGDCFVAGSVFGRVRAMVTSDGAQVEDAGPSIPVEVLGASSPALAGDDFYVLATEAEAREIAENRARQVRVRELSARNRLTAGGPLTLESFAARVAEGEQSEFPLIVKGDVQGSVEAVGDAVVQLSTPEVRVVCIHKGVGAVTENDVQLAVASNAIIIAFNIRAETHAAQMAEEQGVHILYSRIIYELMDSVKAAIIGTLAPEYREKTLGRVEVRKTFKVPRMGMVAGSYVVDGVVQRGALVRLLRDNRVIHEGKMASLRRFKDDVREVAAGYECGIGIEGYSDIKDGDIIEVYKLEEVARVQ